MIKFLFSIFWLIASSSLLATVPVDSWQSIKFKNTLKQKTDYTCGAAALATLMNRYGATITERDIMIIIGKKTFSKHDIETLHSQEALINYVTDKTITLLDLSKAAMSYEFNAIGLKASFKTLHHLNVPAIVHLKTDYADHFSVLIGYGDSFVTLADPAWGNITMTHQKFKKLYTEKLLVISPKSAIPQPLSLKKTNKNLNFSCFL